jgi:hypothetical protein
MNLSLENPSGFVLNYLLILPVVVILMIVTIGGGPYAMDLTPYQWKNRIAILFSPSESECSYQSFREQLRVQREGVLDRQLLVIHVFEEGGENRLGDSPLSQKDVTELRKRFSPLTGIFNVVLIGKDGGVKLRQEAPITLNEIFSTIDAMPMRRQEMKERTTKKRGK